MSATSCRWNRSTERPRPPFVGERINAGTVEARTILSYTSLESAKFIAEEEGFNRIVWISRCTLEAVR